MIIEHSNDTAINPSTREIDAVEDILRRYPRVSDDEIDRAVDFLVDAPILERGRLSSRPGMPEKMEQLRRDRPRAFRPSMLGYAGAAVLIAAILAFAIMVADIG